MPRRDDYWLLHVREARKASMQRRRAKARAKGWCIVCCAHPARPQRVTCEACKTATIDRQRRRRARQRETDDSQVIEPDQKRAGGP